MNCEEGSDAIQRDSFGYIVFGIGLAVLVIAVGISCFRRYKKDLWNKQADMLANQVDSIRVLKRRKAKIEQLERLRPQLEIIAKRLVKLEEEESSKSSKKSSFASSGATEMIQVGDKLVFKASRIFDILDTDKDGKLSYDELNTVLGLEDYELQNFVKRMQELGGLGIESTEVSRNVFVKYFLQVLEENSHLNITAEEAAATYNEILTENNNAYVLNEQMLYSSSISRILSDQQIYMLIKVKYTDSAQKNPIVSSELDADHLTLNLLALFTTFAEIS